ncbi:MAG: polysaccharide deacetylase family protein [Acidobacteriota bacterium]|nr:polysaccharide deacetylase family protein [Acidobacteriota bacterium]
MKRNFLCLAVLIVLSVCLINLQAQDLGKPFSQRKEIAVTIDDLPLNGAPIQLKRLRAMTEKILSGINKYQIPTVGFVNESLLYTTGETDARIAVLKNWTDAGVELGNHTFSHLGFKNASLVEYEDDFIRGETVTKMLMKQKGQKIRYFRHPFLQMGTTPELEKSFESFIAERGYRIAPVTMDTMDWMFLAAYTKAKEQGDAEMIKRVSEEYIKFAALKFDFCEKVSGELFGRQIKHILLLHANELNADNFDRLIKVMKDRGYQFIALEEALKDPIYQFPDKYAGTSDWLGEWAFSKGEKFASPTPPEFIQKIYSDSQK